jgi:hypothetical protein
MKKGKVIRQAWVSRDDVKQHRDRIYVFGDNMERVGMGGQAASMRGEPNTIGVPTKWRPSMADDAFYSDDDLERVIPAISQEFKKLQDHIASGRTVVIPAGGLGTGLSSLQQRAPRVLEYIEGWIEALEIASTT